MFFTVERPDHVAGRPFKTINMPPGSRIDMAAGKCIFCRRAVRIAMRLFWLMADDFDNINFRRPGIIIRQQPDCPMMALTDIKLAFDLPVAVGLRIAVIG